MFIICEVKDRSEIEAMYKEEMEKDPVKPKPISLFENTNVNSFIDVHVYDGKTDRIELIKCSEELQRSHIEHLKKLFRHPSSVMMLNMILNRNNFDPSNNVDSADLLVWVCCNPITPDLFFLLEEQLGDNGSLGNCLQGSSHRIRQIYYAQKAL